MPNHIYEYVFNIKMILKHFVDEALKRARVKWFQVLLYSSHNLTPVICLQTVCSIWALHRILLVVTAPGIVDLEVIAIKGYSTFPQISKSRASSSGGLVSYPGHSLEIFFPSVQMQSVYSTAPVNRARIFRSCQILFSQIQEVKCKYTGVIYLLKTFYSIQYTV